MTRKRELKKAIRRKKVWEKFNIWDVEDPESAGMNEIDQIKMWQHLVDTGMAWKLQGWYGRNASRLIEDGIIQPPKKKTKQNSYDYYGNQIW